MTGASLLPLLLTPSAHAFCGTYVGEAGSELFNSASQVVMVRQDGRTTLNLANDFEGDLSAFAMVIPVPEVLGESDVTVIEPELIERLATYSAPRLVKYTCDDFWWEYQGWDTGMLWDASASSEGTEEATGSVSVEAEFSAGEYQIVILSAEESASLLTWLDQEGYAVSPDAQDLLQEYIDAGTYFLAAKVALDAVPEGQSYLRPLQFSYASEAFSLPVRLGTINSPGQQDLLLYVLNERDQGRAGIANYPEVEVEDECMVDLPDAGIGSDFGDFFNEGFDTPRVGLDRAGWTVEYGWSPYHCDPCAGDPPETEELQGLGWEGDRENSYLTRLHLRYGPGQVDQDLTLYSSQDTENTQIRYILYDPYLEDRFPICGQGMADDPGSCAEYFGVDEDPDPDPTDPGRRWGCGVPLAPASGAMLLGLLALGVRRRE